MSKKCNLPIGTVVFTSNLDPKDNQTPGIFNHCLIIVNENQDMIEAQQNQGVILISWEDFQKRPYDWNGRYGVLYPLDRNLGIQAAEHAKQLIGQRYGFLSSVRLFSRKFNCVKVVADAYAKATNMKITAVVPDDLIKYNNIFTDKIEKSK